MKSILRAILGWLGRADDWLDRIVPRIAVVLLGLRVGNVYAPEWAPHTRDRIVGLDDGCVSYETYSPAPDRTGCWIQGGGGRDPSPFYWWLNRAFTQYCPPSATGVTLL